jgi:hypothetical protein
LGQRPAGGEIEHEHESAGHGHELVQPNQVRVIEHGQQPGLEGGRVGELVGAGWIAHLDELQRNRIAGAGGPAAPHPGTRATAQQRLGDVAGHPDPGGPDSFAVRAHARRA